MCGGVRLAGPSEASFYAEICFWPETSKTREGDKACNLVAASRDLLIHVSISCPKKESLSNNKSANFYVNVKIMSAIWFSVDYC